MANPNSVTARTPNYQASYEIVTVPSYSPAAVAAATTAENATTMTVPGVRAAVAATPGMPAVPADEVVEIRGPNTPAGVFPISARVTADDTVAVTFANVTAGSLTPTAASQYVLTILRQTKTAYSFDG